MSIPGYPPFIPFIWPMPHCMLELGLGSWPFIRVFINWEFWCWGIWDWRYGFMLYIGFCGFWEFIIDDIMFELGFCP